MDTFDNNIINATLDELRSYLAADYAGTITIEHVRLDRDGYSSSGIYYGVVPGTAVFTVWWSTEAGGDQYRDVRAARKRDLITYLWHAYPAAKIAGHRRRYLWTIYIVTDVGNEVAHWTSETRRAARQYMRSAKCGNPGTQFVLKREPR